MNREILLGYELGKGDAVFVENTHMLVTGLTNKTGKTTTIAALAERSARRVLVFATKPGEKVFEETHNVQPFYSEKSDWQYVESILSATMKERMRFERAWIIRATKGTMTLREVDFNCIKFAKLAKVGSLENNVFSNLHAYFEIVLPQIEKIQFAKEFPDLEMGVNVMDLTAMKEETQSLVIRACLDHISHEETGMVVVMPELWKFAPEGRGNPVKPMLEFLIRQGATKQNFVWMDSQDLAGVDKLPLKQVYTWIMGLQTERNEVQHTLDQLPLPRKSKPEADEIMTLKLGQFILATPMGVKKVYVQPGWMDETTAQHIARGQIVKLPEAPIANKRTPTIPILQVESSQPTNTVPIVELEEKQMVIKIIHSQSIIRETTENLRGQVLFILYHAARPLSQPDIIKEANEHGWAIGVDSLRTNIRKYVEEGLVVQEEERGPYRLPRFVRHDIKEIQA